MSQQFPTSIGAQTDRPPGPNPKGAESQQFPTSIGAQTRSIAHDSRHTSVPAVPDFDRCSDPPATRTSPSGSARSQQFPTSIGAQTERRETLVFSRHESQQFPTSIGAQTGAPRRPDVVRDESQQFPTSIGAQTRGPDAHQAAPKRVPAVPDFDRCSDEWSNRTLFYGQYKRPSSSRLRSVLRLR